MTRISTVTLLDSMLHEVPRGRQQSGDDAGILYSSSVTPLDAATDRFIREQMLNPYLAAAREIVDGHIDRTPTVGAVRDILHDASALPERSRVLADWMHKSQRAMSSAGLVLVATAESEVGNCVIVMKAEHQEGVRLNHREVDGNIVFETEHLTELIIGQNSRVYKIGVLWLEGDQVVGLMVDQQNGAGFADFFLSEFLGCQLREPAEVLTQQFVKGMSAFINKSTLDQEKRERYARALVTVLESPATRLRPATFLTEFIDVEDRDLATTFLGQSVAHMDIRKDLTLVKNKVGGLTLDFDAHVKVILSSEALDNGLVEIVDEQTIIHAVPERYLPSRKPH